MKEYFIVADGNFTREWNFRSVKAKTPQKAAEKVRKDYKHRLGLFALYVYKDEDAFKGGEYPLFRLLSKAAKEAEEARGNIVEGIVK